MDKTTAKLASKTLRRASAVYNAASAAVAADASASQGSMFSLSGAPHRAWLPENLGLRLLIHPQSPRLQRWFVFIVFVSLLVGWLGPYDMSFGGHGALKDSPLSFWAWVEYVASALFAADLAIKFFVAFHDPETGILVSSYARIAAQYLISYKFPCDLVSALPLDTILHVCGMDSAPPRIHAGVAFLKMLQLVRLYRVFEFFHQLDYSLSLGQGTLLVVRNTTYAFYVTHWAACMFYQVAQVEGSSPDSWVGRNVERFAGRPQHERYLLSLYFSVSAFTGLGDGALYASTVPEAAFMICYLFFNLFLGAYILGTVTMLVVKGDERSKLFRDRMYSLADFSRSNELPQSLYSAMQEHLEVTFQADTASDEQVLGIYPTAIRRKVLRHLYLQPVRACYLFRGCKQRFLDALLTAARVELFMPGVQIMTEGDNVTELLIMVSGEVAVTQHKVNVNAAYSTFAASALGGEGSSHHTVASADGSLNGASGGGAAAAAAGGGSGRRSISGGGAGGGGGFRSRFGFAFGLGSGKAPAAAAAPAATAVGGGSTRGGGRAFGSGAAAASAADASSRGSFLGSSQHGGAGFDMAGSDMRSAGSALAEVAFFTDIPSHEAALSTTVVRALSLPKAAWELLVEQFPQQARIVLDNLQARQEADLYSALHAAALVSQLSAEQLDTAISLIKAKDGMESVDPALVAETRAALTQAQMEALMRLDDVRAVVRAHVRKVDHLRIYRFLQQAAQGDVETLRNMLNQGMSANSADYDGRTGLMLAAAAGHEAVVRLLLDHGAKADQLDSFGNSALSEACKAGNDKAIDLLLGYGATLGMDGLAVAGTLCTAVFEGDLVKLRRLLRAGAPPDACDYDRRSALHIAGAEGNLAAVKLLVEEGGADPNFQDRWGNTPLDEARRVGAAPVVAYLQRLMSQDRLAASDERWRRQVKSEFLGAAGRGDVERLTALFAGPRPPCMHTALLVAASEGQAGAVEALAKWAGGWVLDRCGPLALLDAADMGNVEVVRCLRAAGVCLPAPRDPALAAALEGAVLRQDVRCVVALLEAGVPVLAAGGGGGGGAGDGGGGGGGNKGGKEGGGGGGVGGSALHLAAGLGNLDLVRLLVELGGAAADVADASGASAAALADRAVNAHPGSRNHRSVAAYLAWAAGAGSGPEAKKAAEARHGPLPDVTAAAGGGGGGGGSAGGSRGRSARRSAADDSDSSWDDSDFASAPSLSRLPLRATSAASRRSGGALSARRMSSMRMLAVAPSDAPLPSLPGRRSTSTSATGFVTITAPGAPGAPAAGAATAAGHRHSSGSGGAEPPAAVAPRTGSISAAAPPPPPPPGPGRRVSLAVARPGSGPSTSTTPETALQLALRNGLQPGPLLPPPGTVRVSALAAGGGGAGGAGGGSSAHASRSILAQRASAASSPAHTASVETLPLPAAAPSGPAGVRWRELEDEGGRGGVSGGGAGGGGGGAQSPRGGSPVAPRQLLPPRGPPPEQGAPLPGSLPGTVAEEHALPSPRVPGVPPPPPPTQPAPAAAPSSLPIPVRTAGRESPAAGGGRGLSPAASQASSAPSRPACDPAAGGGSARRRQSSTPSIGSAASASASAAAAAAAAAGAAPHRKASQSLAPQGSLRRGSTGTGDGAAGGQAPTAAAATAAGGSGASDKALALAAAAAAAPEAGGGGAGDGGPVVEEASAADYAKLLTLRHRSITEEALMMLSPPPRSSAFLKLDPGEAE